MARKRNKSRQGRKNPFSAHNIFFRPSGASSTLRPQPTVETVGYSRSSLTGLRNLCSSVSSVVRLAIVRRVEGLFALADQIEARFAQVRLQVDQLTPSLLARAFRGHLVLQDPTDEPAEKLLERIKKENS